MKFDVKSLIEQVAREEAAKIKDEMSQTSEAKAFKVNPKYNVFAIEKATNKIVNGWDLDPKDKDNLRDYIKKTSPYVKMDLKDLDYKPSEIDIVSVATAKSKGLDPFNWDSWKKSGQESPEVKEAITTIVTPDGKTMTPAQQAQVKTAKPGTTIVTKKAGELTETIAPDDIVKLVDLIVYAPLAIWQTYPWGKKVLADPSFKAEYEKAKDPEAKKSLLKSALSKLGMVKEDVSIDEKKDKSAEELSPVEDKPIEDTPAPEAKGGVSGELNDHISAAIDAAAKCIQDSGDKKYEKVLGKVIKNLTAAQQALEDVQAHESKLAEQAAIEAEKTTTSYKKDLRKMLKKNFRNPDHIEQIITKYGKVINKSTDKPVAKIAEMITAHALKEGVIKKGDLLN